MTTHAESVHRSSVQTGSLIHAIFIPRVAMINREMITQRCTERQTWTRDCTNQTNNGDSAYVWEVMNASPAVTLYSVIFYLKCAVFCNVTWRPQIGPSNRIPRKLCNASRGAFNEKETLWKLCHAYVCYLIILIWTYIAALQGCFCNRILFCVNK